MQIAPRTDCAFTSAWSSTPSAITRIVAAISSPVSRAITPVEPVAAGEQLQARRRRDDGQPITRRDFTRMRPDVQSAVASVAAWPSSRTLAAPRVVGRDRGEDERGDDQREHDAVAVARAQPGRPRAGDEPRRGRGQRTHAARTLIV